MPSRQAPRTAKRLPMLLLFVAAILIAAFFFSQEAAAERIGGFIGGLWVSTMGAVMSLIAAVFGG